MYDRPVKKVQIFSNVVFPLFIFSNWKPAAISIMGSILPQLFLVIEILEIDFSIINIKFYVLLSVPFAEKCNFLKIAIWKKCTILNGLSHMFFLLF